jgi:N-carbamoyl-L-amino-acid hydrolase
MPAIDPARLLADLHALRAIGTYKTGVHRPTYGEDDVRSRHWLAERLTQAGLQTDIDGIGNVIGRDPSPGSKLLLGSHLETQNHAGWLDGAMGVIFGLEVARALGHGIDVAGWADEIDGCKSVDDGTPLRTALASAGFAGKPRLRADPARYRGYLEAHIEQGGTLEDAGQKIGIVTAIVGSHRFRIVFEGQQNHAGTTRMAVRRDAGVALIKLAAAIEDRFPNVVGPRTVWTTGRITLEPGAPSIVPGRAEMLFQFRDTDQAHLFALETELKTLVEQANQGPCRVTIAHIGRSVPRQMDTSFQTALEHSAQRHAPLSHQRMPSGAGHDAQIMAEVMPAGMLFVPSICGVSHHYSEDTKEEDIVLGCQIFADAAADILAAS